MQIVHCLNACPSSLRWKLLTLLGRYVTLIGYHSIGRKVPPASSPHRQFLQRSYRIAPAKSRHAVLLEYSKMEYCGHSLEASLGLLNYGIFCFPAEWKLLLERVQQLTLQEQYSRALELNVSALRSHIGAGRLWSSYIHLIHQSASPRPLTRRMFGPEEAYRVFHTSLKHVAKSGEVWCEGARIYLDPTSRHFNPLNACKCLNFAVFFTPQYGDSFIEAIRLAVITSDVFLAFHHVSSSVHLMNLLRSLTDMVYFIKRSSYFQPNYGPLWFRCQEYFSSSPKEVGTEERCHVGALSRVPHHRLRDREERQSLLRGPASSGHSASGAAEEAWTSRLRPLSRRRRPCHRRVPQAVLLRIQARLHVPSPQPAQTNDPQNEGSLRCYSIG